MTILAALRDRYVREATQPETAPPGYAPAKIHYIVVLSEGGKVLAVEQAARDEKRKRLLKEPLAPQAPASRRGEKIVAGSFWDPSEYALGVSVVDPKATEKQREKAQRKASEKHAAFKQRHSDLLRDSDDPGCLALLLFLQNWEPTQISEVLAGDMLPGSNIGFRLEGEHRFIHDRPAAKAALLKEAASTTGIQTTCLVSGEIAPIARLHPPIKGIGEKLAPLISFNEEAFDSYGRSQGLNAPVSEEVAFAYATALNSLVSSVIGRDEKGKPRWANRIGLGEDTIVFWADTSAAEAIVRGAFDPPPPDDRTEAAEVRTVLQRVERGEPINDATLGTAATTKVYILGLSPNAARLSVRFWRESTLGDFARHFQQHWNDMRIEPPARKNPPPVWALLYELAPRRKIDDGMKQLAGEWLRAIVTGGNYPGSLLAQTLMRMRAEHDAPALRVAIIKAVLTRRARKAWEEARRQDPMHPDWKDCWMALNRDEPHTGYRLGRLFAVLEAAQYAGLGRRVNAGVRDKFFGSASATPRHIFPSLLRNVQDHLAAARKRKREGRANRLDGEIREILGGLTSPGLFPAILEPEDQGAFVVGFYHQDADLRVPRVKDETIDTPDTDDESDQDGED